MLLFVVFACLLDCACVFIGEWWGGGCAFRITDSSICKARLPYQITNKFVSLEAYVKCISARRSKYRPFICMPPSHTHLLTHGYHILWLRRISKITVFRNAHIQKIVKSNKLKMRSPTVVFY